MLISVRGNHEQYLIEGLPKEIHDDKRKMSMEEIKNHEWNHNKLSEESKKFISELQISNTIQIENKKIYVVHYPFDKNYKYKKHIKNPSIEESNEMFQEIDADIFLYGHTHTVSANNLNGKWYINPGSVGCPLKNNTASVGLLDINVDNINFNHLSIEYDVDEAMHEIEKIKFPFYKEVLRIFYGKE
jgi:putative phosphoesterase